MTFWLQRWQGGDDGALEELTRLLYDDLRRLAGQYMREEYPGHMLQATALVHEMYLRVSSVQNMDWQGRQHFISVAAQMMRRILVDHARKRQAAKRSSSPSAGTSGHVAALELDVLDVHRALEKMTAAYPRQTRIVELRFFGGLDAPEIAEVLCLSLRTVERDWRFAKAWLQHEIS